LKYFKSILRIGGVTLGILVFLSILGFFSTLLWPQIVVNEKTLNAFSSMSAYFGIPVSWKQVRVQLENKSILHKKLAIQFEDFCFNFSKNTYEGCIQTLSFAGEAVWREKKFQILELGPILMTGAKLNLHFHKQEPPPDGQNSLELKVPDLVLPSFFRSTHFQKIEIEVSQWNLWQEDEIYSGTFKLGAEPNEFQKLNGLQVSASLDENSTLSSADLSGELSSTSSFEKNDWILNASLKTTLRKGGRGEFTLKALPVQPDVYSLNLDAKVQQNKIVFDGHVQTELKKGEWKGSFSALSQGFSPYVQKVKTQDCSFSLHEIEKKNDKLRFSLDCPLLVDLTPLRVPNSTFEHLVTMPYNLDLRIKSDLETSFFPSLDKPVSGTLEIILNTLSQELLTAKGSTTTHFAGIPSEYPKNWNLETLLDLQIKLPHFQRLVKSLEKTAFAIFAPLNSLQGNIDLKFSGKADLAREEGKIPLSFSTNLQSSEQSFKTEGQGEFNYKFSKKTSAQHLDFDLSLQDLKLVAPHMGLDSIPNLFPDSRFVDSKPPVVSSKKKDFTYSLRVQTPPDHPIRLLSNLTKTDIPIFTDLTLNEKKLGGTLQIGKTEINFFRRNAQVQKFNLTLQEPREKSIVDGLFRVNYADYKIDIIVVGNIKKPAIIFQSDPPLNQDQILSVLIYGRTFEDLNADNSSSISAISTAIADRVVALSSLFLLASSPIESIQYNPKTGAFSAKVKIAQGTSLELGTQQGKTQELGLRKNLKGNWLIRTYIQNNTQTGTQSGGAFLEWYKRY